MISLSFFLGFIDAGNILEGDLLLLHGEQAGAGLAEAHGLIAAGLHLAEQEEPEAEEQSKGRDEMRKPTHSLSSGP